MENIGSAEKLPVLSERDAYDTLFWSFFYSQGSEGLQRRILNYQRRHSDLPKKIIRRHRFDENFSIQESDPYDKGDRFSLPNAELAHYQDWLAGAHQRNTSPAQEQPKNIKKMINRVIGEYVRPEEFN